MIRRGRNKAIELHIPSQLGWERAAMDLAESVAKRMGFPPERIEDIRTAVAEATLNAMEHGHGLDVSQKVLIDLIPQDEKLEISVRDRSSTPFSSREPLGQQPDLEAKLAAGADTRGWGMFLIKELVDEVEFSSSQRGNVVRMVIYVEPEAS